MLTLRLPPAFDARLTKAARAARLTKSAFVREALAERLAETDDLRVATARLRALAVGKSRLHSAEEVKRELGLRV